MRSLLLPHQQQGLPAPSWSWKVIGVRFAQTECKLNLVLIKHTLQITAATTTTTAAESTNEMETQTTKRDNKKSNVSKGVAARSVVSLFFHLISSHPCSKSKSIKGKTKQTQCLRRKQMLDLIAPNQLTLVHANDARQRQTLNDSNINLCYAMAAAANRSE